MFRPTGNGPAIHIKNSSNLCLPGGEYSSWSIPGGTPRSVVSAVPDLKGSDDGNGDFIVLDPDRMEWLRYHSQTNGTYVQQPVIQLGHSGAVPL